MPLGPALEKGAYRILSKRSAQRGWTVMDSDGRESLGDALETPIVGLFYELSGDRPVSVLQTLRVGHVARRAAMSQYGKLTDGAHSWRLSGHEAKGPARQGHRHAFYLPLDDDGDGRLDHLLVFVPEGLNVTELNAVAALSYLQEAVPPWHLDVRLQRLLVRDEGRDGVATLAACRPSTVWRSVTPFLLNRYPKRYRDGRPKWNERGEQIDGPEDQLRRELRLRPNGGEAARSVVRIERIACGLRTGGHSAQELGWDAFERQRPGARGAVRMPAYGFEVEFAEPVAGPLALGYGNHFGLGMFRPVDEK